MASQSMSSVTNFIIAALALAAGDLASFGRFSIAFQICQLVIVIGQGSIGTSVLVHASEEPRSRRSSELRAGASAAALVLGVSASVIIAVGALVSGDGLRIPLLLAALGAPVLVAQYQLRAQRFSMGDPVGALVADLVWLAAVLGAGLFDLFGVWDPSTNAYLAVWLGGAAISSLPVLVVGISSGWRHLGFFWSVAGAQTIRMGLESALARSVFVTSLVTAQVMIGSAASGALAAAVLALSPMSVVHEATTLYFVPRIVGSSGIHVLRRQAVLKITSAVVAATALWIVAVIVINVADVGRGPFDLDANDVGGLLFAATAARFLALAAWRGPQVALRIADAAHESLRARAIGTVAQYAFPIAGFALSGLTLGVAGIALGTWVGATAAWLEWKRLDSQATDRVQHAGDPSAPGPPPNVSG